MPPRRIILVNRFFAPDQSATSRLLSDLAAHLAQERSAVLVIASRDRYDGSTDSLPARETIAGAQVYRTVRARFGRANLFYRALDSLAIYFSFARALARLAQPGDIVVVKTDPPMLSIALAPVIAAKRLVLVNWLQDLYPEIALALGLRAVAPLAPVLLRARNASLRLARKNVVVAERMRDRLLAQKIAPERIDVIANWCDDEQIAPAHAHDNRLRREWALAGRFVVGYSGTLGRAHEFHTALEAAALLKNEPEICFVFVGGGYQAPVLRREVERRGLTETFRFHGFQDAQILPLTIALPDIHWLSSPPAMEGLLLPSKFYGIAAAGRPIIAIADRDSEIAGLIRRHECGVVVQPGDSATLAQSIRAYRDAPALVARHGRNARNMLDANFRKQDALDRWAKLLDNI